MRKVLPVFVAVCLVVALCTGVFVTVPEARADTDGDYTYTVSGGNATITAYTNVTATTVTIPGTLGGYPVTSIGSFAFGGQSALTSVTIPDSVTSIGFYAFHECSALTSVTIPDSVTSISEYAFQGCTGLASVTIGSGVTSISYNAFQSCTALTQFIVDASNLSYSSSATGVLFSKNGTSLILYPPGKSGGYVIPDSVTSLGNWAFYYCTGLASVTIGSGVTSIGDAAFLGCTGLTQFIVDASNLSYSSSATGVLFSKNGTSLILYPPGKSGGYVIPDSVTNIGGCAFRCCTGLTSVTIGSGVTSISYNAFQSCTALTTVTIPDSVTSIGSSAFQSCTGLTSVTIGSGVTSIGYFAFTGCGGLTSVIIPNSVTSIGGYAVSYCWGLTSVTIGSGVTSIGDGAFQACGGLTSVIIPNSVTSLGGWAFSDCWGLTSVTIGSGVTSVGGAAFSGCVGLTAAHFLGNAPTMGTTVFASCGVGFTFTVLYDNSTSGWTNPWYTYPTAAFASYITSSAGPGGSISPSSEVMVLLNHDQTFTISPDTSYHVADVLVDGNSVGAVTSYTFTNVTAAHTITASFAINTHTLTVNTVGVGTVGKSPDQALYDYGTVVTLTAAPTPGYHFLSWCGATPDSVDPLKATVTMESDTTVTATFTTTIDTFPITALAGVNGTITPSGSVLVTYGASQSFTITPDLNYMIDTLTVDGVIVSNATNQLGWTVTLTNVMSSHTITVTFKSVPDVVPPTIALPDFGTITGVSGYSGGSVQIFTVSTSPFNLEFTVDDNSGSAKWTIKVNGVVVIDPVGIGLMTYPLPLVEGRNDVEISARDATGNSTSKELIIFLDSMNPVLTIAPALPVSVTNSELTITGSVVDTGSGLKHFTINGTEVIPFLDGSFSEKLLLTKGANSIILTAEDRVGHQVTTTYTVTYAAAVPTFLPAMTVTLTIGKTAMDVNGMPVTLDAAPVIQNNRTLLPIRALIETLGGTVVWDATTRTATVTLKSRTVSVTIGNPMGLVNGKKVAIDPANPKVVPLILNSRTFLPLRFIAENLGLDLAWDALTRTISFTYWP